ncbi:hypothetical protein V5799_019888 [Amblyomma americanum]|uniref:ELYS-like domain-containing protein n=1 Tax=Amblyomma americanum TaxID=6943 RepID=A0AAQ4EW09_AMBAM
MQMANQWLVAVSNDVAGLLFRLLSALLFLLQSRLLSDHHVSEGCLVYPYSALQTWLQQAKSDQSRKLVVDIVLVEAALGDAADPCSLLREGSPSPSIHSATDIYPVCGLEPWTPHVVTYYLLLNIAIIFHDYPPVKEKLKHFPSAIDLSSYVQILVDDIRHLDQGRHEEGEECLLKAQQQASAELRPLLGALWAPGLSLLHQCRPPLKLRCLDHVQVASTPEQMKLQLYMLLANCRVIDALELVRRHGHLSSLEQLLTCIMTLARTLKMSEAYEPLELVLQGPLSAAEKEQLVSCFCELAEPTWMHHVKQHFLQCKSFHAALLLTGCLQELFREGSTQQPYLREVQRNVSSTLAPFMRPMPLPASQLNAVARRRHQSGAPAQYQGFVPTRVPRKDTTPRLATLVAAVRVTMDAGEAYRPPAMPSAPSWLVEEAASILCTPSVILREGHPRRTTSAEQPSKSGLASILTGRPMELRPVVATPVFLPRGCGEHAGACLTPTELGVDVQPIPADPSVRRLRFAMSDSNLSQASASPEVDTTGQSRGDSSMLSLPSKETDISSDRYSQFKTPMGHDSDDSGTDLQNSTPGPVRSPQPMPEQLGPCLQQHRSTDHHTDEKKAPGPGFGDTSYLEGKALLQELLIQEAARYPHALSADDSAVAGPAQPEAKESLFQRSPAAAAPSLAVSVETSDEEGLDGTPLMESYEDTVPESKSRPHFPPHGKDLSRGPVATAPEERKAILTWVAAAARAAGAAHVGIAQFRTAQVSTAQLGAAALATPHVRTSLVGSPHFGTRNFGTAKFGSAHFGTAHFGNSQVSAPQFGMPAEAGEPTILCDNDGTELAEDTASRCFCLAPAVSLHMPAFALSEEQHTPEEEDEPVIEQHGVIISAFEASEREKEEKGDGAILSYTYTEALLQMQPTRMESPEASWSRSSGLSTRKTEAPLDELSNMEESPSHVTTRSGA